MGVARARDLSGGRAVSEKTKARMRSFFARHDTPEERKARKDPMSRASIAWDLWGGDAGRRWAALPNPPLLPLTRASKKWDATAARRAVKKWATSDGRVDMKKYARAFLAVDGDPNNLTSYKLPIAYPMRSGARTTLKAVPNAIAAAAGSLDGARGGVMLPQAQRTKARAQLARYYKKLKKTPPWKR